MAVDLGATVIGTTRSAARVLIDAGRLAEQVRDLGVEGAAVLDLVGNTVLRDSLQAVRPQGRVCQVGFLGGLGPVDDFNPIANLPTSVQLSFFGSFVLGAEHYPVDDVPVAELVAKAEAGVYRARPARVFRFDEIAEAHRLIEANQLEGKGGRRGPLTGSVREVAPPGGATSPGESRPRRRSLLSC